MKVENTRFGTVEVPDEQLIQFPNGIIGFPDAKRYVILEHSDKSPLRWLLCCDRPELSFMIIDPLPLVPDFPTERLLKDSADLELGDKEDVAIVALVTIPPPPGTPSVNLMAPLIMGVESRKGKQVVLHDSTYHTRHPLMFSPVEEGGKEGAQKDDPAPDEKEDETSSS